MGVGMLVFEILAAFSPGALGYHMPITALYIPYMGGCRYQDLHSSATSVHITTRNMRDEHRHDMPHTIYLSVQTLHFHTYHIIYLFSPFKSMLASQITDVAKYSTHAL
jgi:hypothetical protein